MKRIQCLTIVITMICFLTPATSMTQESWKKTKKGNVFGKLSGPTPQEQLVRDTYLKLEKYNAASQVQRNEFDRSAFREEANLKFELSGFQLGNIAEILDKPYPSLITMPRGEIISLSHGSHSLNDGPSEATFSASWEHGSYSSLSDRVDHRRYNPGPQNSMTSPLTSPIK